MSSQIILAAVSLGLAVLFIIAQHLIVRKRDHTVDCLCIVLAKIADGKTEVYRDDNNEVCFRKPNPFKENNNGDR